MPTQPSPQQDLERRKQLLGLLIIAALILAFTAWRAGWHRILPPGWWR